ncbi:MAG: hypothetical protein WEC15_03390, partial [Flavobacteriales bacterium]
RHRAPNRIYGREFRIKVCPEKEDFIFVEGALRALALERLGKGQYLITFPNGNSNRYVYRAGLLYEIHVQRPLVNLVFRRA